VLLPDGVPAEALVAGEAKAAAKGKAAKPARKPALRGSAIQRPLETPPIGGFCLSVARHAE